MVTPYCRYTFFVGACVIRDAIIDPGAGVLEPESSEHAQRRELNCTGVFQADSATNVVACEYPPALVRVLEAALVRATASCSGTGCTASTRNIIPR